MKKLFSCKARDYKYSDFFGCYLWPNEDKTLVCHFADKSFIKCGSMSYREFSEMETAKRGTFIKLGLKYYCEAEEPIFYA